MRVEGVDIEKSQGEEEALDEVTADDIDPREEWILSARGRGARVTSFPGMIRLTCPDPISFRPRAASVKSSGRPIKRVSRA